jgi:hypothetical protein
MTNPVVVTQLADVPDPATATLELAINLMLWIESSAPLPATALQY